MRGLRRSILASDRSHGDGPTLAVGDLTARPSSEQGARASRPPRATPNPGRLASRRVSPAPNLLYPPFGGGKAPREAGEPSRILCRSPRILGCRLPAWTVRLAGRMARPEVATAQDLRRLARAAAAAWAVKCTT